MHRQGSGSEKGRGSRATHHGSRTPRGPEGTPRAGNSIWPVAAGRHPVTTGHTRTRRAAIGAHTVRFSAIHRPPRRCEMPTAHSVEDASRGRRPRNCGVAGWNPVVDHASALESTVRAPECAFAPPGAARGMMLDATRGRGRARGAATEGHVAVVRRAAPSPSRARHVQPAPCAVRVRTAVSRGPSARGGHTLS